MSETNLGREHVIRLAGSKLHYWVYGPSQGAPVIIAIHGFRGTHHGLERIIEQLPDYTVIAPDLPGFGDSTPMEDIAHDIDGYAELFAQFIPIVTGPRDNVILLGHSFGSIVAAKLVADGGTNAKKLILINPIAKQPHIVGRLGSILYFAVGGTLSEHRARKYFGWPVAINALSLQMTKTRHRPTREYVKDQHLTHFSRYSTKQTLRESFQASVTRTVGEYASKIKIPTLLIAGERDEIAPLKSQLELYKSLDTPTELAVIPNVGHLVHYETPTEVATYITAFIED